MLGKWISTGIVAGLLALAPSPLLAQSISGPAQAIDGDTLSFTGIRVRLLGIDAVELKQTCNRGAKAWSCGQDAKIALSALVDGKFLTCSGKENDSYGRLIARCRVDGLDVGEAMVSAGLATALPQFSTDYVEIEDRARRLGLGIWASDFVMPADWRAAHAVHEPRAVEASEVRAPSTEAHSYRDRSGRCTIKGNHSQKGEWIYHLPGQAYYEQTRPEQIFCTEEAAQRAGYRPSKV